MGFRCWEMDGLEIYTIFAPKTTMKNKGVWPPTNQVVFTIKKKTSTKVGLGGPIFIYNIKLLGGFSPPIWKILHSQIGSFLQGSAWKFQKYLSCHHQDKVRLYQVFLVGALATPLISDRTGERKKPLGWCGTPPHLCSCLKSFCKSNGHPDCSWMLIMISTARPSYPCIFGHLFIPYTFICHDAILGGEVDPTRNPTKCHDSPPPP